MKQLLLSSIILVFAFVSCHKHNPDAIDAAQIEGRCKSRVSDTREHHPMVQQSAQNRSIVIFFGRGTSLNLRMALSTWAKKAQVSTHPSEDIPEVFSILSLTTNYLFQSKYSRIMRRMQAVVGLLR